MQSLKGKNIVTFAANNRKFPYGACVVIGSSRGLGRALVEQLLRRGSPVVAGFSRSESVMNQESSTATGVYLHTQLDVSERDSSELIRREVEALPHGPLLVIFNAACIIEDVREDGTLDPDMFEQINRTGIGGLGQAVTAVQERLLREGGLLLAISSINALSPSISDRMAAYPASKAYLTMLMRSLALHWSGKVKVSVIHLGHIGGTGDTFLCRLLNPSYHHAASWIVTNAISRHCAMEITYPWPYRFVYRYLLRVIPDHIYALYLSRLLKGNNRLKQWIAPAKNCD